MGEHNLQLDFWPFDHQPPRTVLRRQGTPFWDYLDAAGISSTFYDLPSNYPASPSKYGHHRCICGMGTPDLLGSYGTYQFFAEDGPEAPLDEAGGKRMLQKLIDFRERYGASQAVRSRQRRAAKAGADSHRCACASRP